MAKDGDILDEARDLFRSCEEREADNRDEALDDLEFARLARQWRPEDEEQRAAEGRPCLTINRMPAFIRQVVNDARQNAPAIAVRAVDDAADPATAEVMSDLIRDIEAQSSADIAYDTAVDFAVSCGFGYFRINTAYTADDAFDQDIRIARIANPFSVYGDPFSDAPDSSDWNVAFVLDRMTRVSDLPDKAALTVRPAIAIRPGMYQADDGTLRTIPFKQQPIGPVKGYPESGGNQWRANNDDDIVGAINSHHAKHGFLPGDEQFMTPGLMKSWQMQESGSTLHRKAFESDPFTVNSPADWKNTARDKERYGLRHRQAMTPATSAAAALEWMLHQGVQRGLLSGQRDALQFYNTRKDPTYKYADDVLNRYRNSYEDNL